MPWDTFWTYFIQLGLIILALLFIITIPLWIGLITESINALKRKHRSDN